VIGSGEGFDVRPAEAADAGDLVELQRQIYREERWFVGDSPPSVAALTQRLRSLDPGLSLWLVADAGPHQPGRLRGWLELHRLPPARMRHVATLTLAVAARWRRHGIGRTLMGHCYGWARGVGVRKISLNVRSGNEGALRLYEGEGFVLEGRERQQIRTHDGYEDNLIMARFMD
jgi:ribosomal protein S18 acetylase RimI-like enzyme